VLEDMGFYGHPRTDAHNKALDGHREHRRGPDRARGSPPDRQMLGGA
jgi:hypothetical protein